MPRVRVRVRVRVGVRVRVWARVRGAARGGERRWEEVAIKLENTKTKHEQLHYEAKPYKLLNGGFGQ